MPKFKKYHAHIGILGWSLLRRLAGLAGLAAIVTGYGLIVDSSSQPDPADVETVTRLAVSGMMLVFVGGVIEALVLLKWSRH